eukprot:g65583.t1
MVEMMSSILPSLHFERIVSFCRCSGDNDMSISFNGYCSVVLSMISGDDASTYPSMDGSCETSVSCCHGYPAILPSIILQSILYLQCHAENGFRGDDAFFLSIDVNPNAVSFCFMVTRR